MGRRPLSSLLRRLSPAFEQSIAGGARAHRPMDQLWWLAGRDGRPLPVRAVLDPAADGSSRLTLAQVGDVEPRLGEPEAMYANQERMGLVDRLVDLAAQGATLKEMVTDSVPLLLEQLAMDAGGCFLVRDGAKAEVVAAYGRTRRRGFPYPTVDVAALRPEVLAQADPVDLRLDESLPVGIEAVACKRAEQLVIVPAFHGGVALAFIVLSRRERRSLALHDRQLLATFGRVLGLAARAHLLSTQSEQSAAALQTAYAVSRAISRSLDLEMTFKVIASNVARVVRGSRCLLLEIEPESGDFVAVATSETEDTSLLGLRVRFRDGGPPFERPTHLAVEDLVWGAGVAPDVRHKLEARSALLIPMHALNEPMGLLLIFSAEENRRYSRAEVELAQEVSEQAAVAIHNARLYRDLEDSREHVETLLTRLARIRDNERQRLASIVHDDILQSVVGTVYQLQAFRGAVPTAALPRLEDTIGVLRAAIDEARLVISDLRPPLLDGLGFAGSMRALVDRADQGGPSRVELSMDDFPDIGSAEAASLYKIAREALTNARRHAHAERIWVEVRREAGEGAGCVRLVVGDDGVGADTTSEAPPDHFGWTMIQEQAAVVGGWAKVACGASGGVVVEAVVPLGHEEQRRG